MRLAGKNQQSVTKSMLVSKITFNLLVSSSLKAASQTQALNQRSSKVL